MSQLLKSYFTCSSSFNVFIEKAAGIVKILLLFLFRGAIQGKWIRFRRGKICFPKNNL
jgi:hypothetical protein